ncbi:transcriptional regulator, AraC family [Chthoniobacter flavus Ellin428]|uniref:Transcriptional regulator, AraC family n=1 Tax=Chthoniobacter flavus Ellin428 TaxID=497964 RepID=B4CUW7_9BACT|nr:AraC family transcriptional regulator [Chthoniobacter flavus]EDY22355.1 transcriptional regulator, AraC family [Chthoniobacter flavus Ellin428]TCO94632.1 AraC-like protein [Chthoniobacter flavus]
MSSVSAPLFEFLAQQRCQPFEIAPQVDARRRLARQFDPELPMLLKFYSFPKYRRMVGDEWMHWHEYFELIVPVCGTGRFQVGDQTSAFAPGDLLVVDNLKLHGVSQLSGPHHSLVIFFPVEAVASSGRASPDEAFLAPLCARPDDTLPVMRHDAAGAERVHRAVLGLAETWFANAPTADRFVSCKLHLLTILAGLREHFGQRQDFQDDLRQRRQRQSRLQKVFAWIAANHARAIKQPQAAAIAGMSASRFREFFKQTTGATFVDYLRELRLTRAAQMLRETDCSIADVAAANGFADQSYLNRCFKARHQCAPLEYRKLRRSKVV